MHNLYSRINALGSFATTLIGVMCILTALSDVFHHSDPYASLKLHSPGRINVMGANDEIRGLELALEADLHSTFHWNTKQLFVYLALEYETPYNRRNELVIWDHIIQSRSESLLDLKRIRPEYKLVDQGRFLNGRQFNVTLTWDITPWVGKIQHGSKTFSGPDFIFRADAPSGGGSPSPGNGMEIDEV